eukprot:scaffold54906_cov69-Phaeocystis_antarctica.AAC.3
MLPPRLAVARDARSVSGRARAPRSAFPGGPRSYPRIRRVLQFHAYYKYACDDVNLSAKR